MARKPSLTQAHLEMRKNHLIMDQTVMSQAQPVTVGQLKAALATLPDNVPLFYSEGSGSLWGFPITGIFRLGETLSDGHHADRPERILFR